MGGVIMPSANNAAPPNIAGITSHFFCLRTNAYNEKIPPSPLLSAINVSQTYFMVVWSVNVQIMHDNEPMINCSLTTLFAIMAFNT